VELTEAIARLRAAGCVFAEDEADVLAEAARGDLADLVARRVQGEPLEQVVGYADFAGVRVKLRPNVFVPRVRSQLLVRTALQHAPAVLLDLCCGSGALGLAVRRRLPSVALYATDIDPIAVACARDNGITDVYQGDLFTPLPPKLRHTVNVLIANVPYVATDHIALLPAEARDHEPRTALDGGPDGLDVFRAVVDEAGHWLAPGGVLLSEITEAQEEAAVDAVRKQGLDAEVIYDEDLEARVIRSGKTEECRGPAA
jgi:release factor glutamine methyltransferase